MKIDLKNSSLRDGREVFTQAKNGDVADSETGELLDTAFAAVIFKKAHNGFSRGGWMAVSQVAALKLAQEKGLGLDAIRTFLVICSRLDFDNLIQINQSEVAKAMGLLQPNFSRSIKKLVELEIILPGPRVGVHRTYRLNPNYGWKGSAKSHISALDDQKKKDLEARKARAGIRGIVGDDASDIFTDVPGQLDLFEPSDGQPIHD